MWTVEGRMTKPLQILRHLFVNKGWMYLFFCCYFHIQKKFMMWRFLNCQHPSLTFVFLSGRKRSTREATVLDNKRTCHNSCHNLLSISIEINFCTHNSRAPNQAIPFYHLDVSEGKKIIFYYIFHPFSRQKSKLHRILFFVLAEGWKNIFINYRNLLIHR